MLRGVFVALLTVQSVAATLIEYQEYYDTGDVDFEDYEYSEETVATVPTTTLFGRMRLERQRGQSSGARTLSQNEIKDVKGAIKELLAGRGVDLMTNTKDWAIDSTGSNNEVKMDPSSTKNIFDKNLVYEYAIEDITDRAKRQGIVLQSRDLSTRPTITIKARLTRTSIIPKPIRFNNRINMAIEKFLKDGVATVTYKTIREGSSTTLDETNNAIESEYKIAITRSSDLENIHIRSDGSVKNHAENGQNANRIRDKIINAEIKENIENLDKNIAPTATVMNAEIVYVNKINNNAVGTVKVEDNIKEIFETDKSYVVEDDEFDNERVKSQYPLFKAIDSMREGNDNDSTTQSGIFPHAGSIPTTLLTSITTSPLRTTLTTKLITILPTTLTTTLTTTTRRRSRRRRTTTTTVPTTTTQGPQFDIPALVDIIANLTYNLEANITDLFNQTLLKYSIPTCKTTTTTTEASLTDLTNASVIAKCYVCGMEATGIPHSAMCADAFAGDFLPLMPVDQQARHKIARFKKYCRYMDVDGVYVNSTQPRSLYGRFTGGCSVRWVDLTGVYTQRACRNTRRAMTGRHFASKRMAKLEMALKEVDNGCIISPMASLLPLSRGVSLFARFHACVCTGSWCNGVPVNEHWLTYFIIIVSALIQCTASQLHQINCWVA
ncbi:hypothetical protein ACJJTC_010979 [Scirpophaga incertulas]